MGDALSKFEHLKETLAGDITQQYKAAMEALSKYKLNESDTYMVKYRDRYSFSNIALFYLENEINHLYIHSEKVYFISEKPRRAGKKTVTCLFSCQQAISD